MKTKNILKDQGGVALVLEFILVAAVAAVLAVVGYRVWQTRHAAKPAAKVSKSAPKAADPYAGWKTYTSTQEKASFKYPPDWTVTAAVQSNNPGADSFAVKSPNGIKVTWVSFIDGLGGACDDTAPLGSDGACALVSVSSRDMIQGARNLSVLTGTITGDGTHFKPWIAVQDTGNEMLKNGRSMGYDEFTGNTGLSHDPYAIFSTGGIYVDGQSMTSAQVNEWFSREDVAQAKLILESLTY